MGSTTEMLDDRVEKLLAPSESRATLELVHPAVTRGDCAAYGRNDEMEEELALARGSTGPSAA